MLWDCERCGCIGIAASLDWCPNCGGTRVSVVVHQTGPAPTVEVAAARVVPAEKPADEPEKVVKAPAEPPAEGEGM